MSQASVNEAVRVLSNTPLKFTITIHKPDGKKIELQSDREPIIDWNNAARCLYLYLWLESYIQFPAMRWQDDYIITVEKNEPKTEVP